MTCECLHVIFCNIVFVVLDSLPQVIQSMGLSHLNQDQVFYDRYFVAEVDNERAGLMTIKFLNDPLSK